MKYIGLDVHVKTTLWYCLDETGIITALLHGSMCRRSSLRLSNAFATFRDARKSLHIRKILRSTGGTFVLQQGIETDNRNGVSFDI
ncbi:MAG: hypothetical protein MK135_16590, partial [Polyangiaceae bacterium]|nr:hypothetical protein [Polyangiaceae bacterium]